MRVFRTVGLPISVAAIGLLTLGACGSSGGSGASATTVASRGGTSAPGTLTIDAEDIKFDKKQYEATAGEVAVDYVSKGQLTHDLLIYDKGNTVVGDTLRVNPGKTVTGTYDLPAGTYTLICDIPGHKDAGMVATLTVK
jgi:uncharacterized cupredoxin-like copper-binding protein